MRNRLPEDGLAVYLRLLRYLVPYLGPFIVSIAGWMVFAATQPAAAKLLEVLVNAIENKDFDARYYIPPAVVGLYFIRGVGSFLGTYFMALVSNRVVQGLRMDVFGHIMHLPVRFFDNTNNGQIISRIIFNTGMVTGAATDALKTLFREGFTVIGLLAYAFYLNWQMSIVFLVIAPLLGLIVVTVGKRLRKLSVKVQDSLADITQACSEAVSNNRVVKTFLGESSEINRFHNAINKNVSRELKMVKVQALNAPVLQLIIVAAMGVIVFLMLQPQFLADMSTGEYVAYITAIGLIPKPVRQLSNINALVQRGIAAAFSVFEVMDMEREKNTGSVKPTRLRGEIEVRNLTFRYDDADEAALQDISFMARPGQVTALVGRSGSGKSTLASLIARFYEYQEGQILVDGVDIRDYDLYAYRRNVGIVTQSVALFNDTIANNIAYGWNKADVDMEVVREAARAAYAAEFIERMPQGYNSIIGENGVKLSGGQKQRLAIARTLFNNNPILILDEATSALDNESERAIQKALDSFMKDRTTIVIAHRLSTIIAADQILVMDGGRIVERGDHRQLLEQNGYYARLYEQGFEE